MRIANKNELSVLFGNQYQNIIRFRLSLEGLEFNMMYNDNTSFDLDLPLVVNTLNMLKENNVIDTNCLNRFNNFKKNSDIVVSEQELPWTHRIPLSSFTSPNTAIFEASSYCSQHADIIKDSGSWIYIRTAGEVTHQLTEIL